MIAPAMVIVMPPQTNATARKGGLAKTVEPTSVTSMPIDALDTASAGRLVAYATPNTEDIIVPSRPTTVPRTARVTGRVSMGYVPVTSDTREQIVEPWIRLWPAPTIVLVTDFVMCQPHPQHATVCHRTGQARRVMWRCPNAPQNLTSARATESAVPPTPCSTTAQGGASVSPDSVEASAIPSAPTVPTTVPGMDCVLEPLAAVSLGSVVMIAHRWLLWQLVRTTALVMVVAMKSAGPINASVTRDTVASHAH